MLKNYVEQVSAIFPDPGMIAVFDSKHTDWVKWVFFKKFAKIFPTMSVFIWHKAKKDSLFSVLFPTFAKAKFI